MPGPEFGPHPSESLPDQDTHLPRGDKGKAGLPSGLPGAWLGQNF